MTLALLKRLADRLGFLRPKAPAPARGIVGSFSHVNSLIEAVKAAKVKKYDVVDVFSPPRKDYQ